MFTSLKSSETERISVSFEGKNIPVRKGLSIAAALLEVGISHFRNTPVHGSARAPFCMMGACFECLLIIDGMPDQQSCMIQVREGMKIEHQPRVVNIGIDASKLSQQNE